MNEKNKQIKGNNTLGLIFYFIFMWIRNGMWLKFCGFRTALVPVRTSINMNLVVGWISVRKVLLCIPNRLYSMSAIHSPYLVFSIPSITYFITQICRTYNMGTYNIDMVWGIYNMYMKQIWGKSRVEYNCGEQRVVVVLDAYSRRQIWI